MKLYKSSLLTLLAILCITSAQAGESNPFAPQNHPLEASQPVTPVVKNTSNKEESANPFAPEEHHTIASTPDSSDEPENPFSHHESKNSEDHALVSAKTEPATPTEHNPFLTKDHRSTAQQTASIKTLHITPGNSATLDPLALAHGVETYRYLIQDKKYESYLSSTIKNGAHGIPTEKNYTITIPATVHSGSFTVFKAQGIHGIPDHFEPVYHVEIQGNPHELISGTQYPEPQNFVFEKLNQLEEKYLTNIQTQFKTFSQEVRKLITTTQKVDDSETKQTSAPQMIITKEPLTLMIDESHLATSFAGGSAQSSDPAIVSATLKFDGTKTTPQWSLILTGHKIGEATITYSTGSESHIQHVIVVEKLMTKELATTVHEDPIEAKNTLHDQQLPTHDDKEKLAEINTQVSTEAVSEPAKTTTDFADNDRRERDDIAHADEPFASFLKESSHDDENNTDFENEEESPSLHEESSQEFPQEDEEEPTEHQEIEK